MDVRIIVKEGDYDLPAREYSEYRWIPEEIFSDNSFYSYHDRLAFLNFREDNVEIMIMRHEEFAQGYRNLFLIAWEKVARPPPLL